MSFKKMKLTVMFVILAVFVFGNFFLFSQDAASSGFKFSNFLKSTFETSQPWFTPDPVKLNMLIVLIVLGFIILLYIFKAQSGKDIYIRKIAGLAAIDDAVGRATEMGRPILYVSGIMDMDDIQTLAGIGILGHVAQKAAEYETPIIVPCSRSMVMSTSQEVVKEAYLRVGRPDAYDRNSVKYITDDQFGFAAGVDGIMVREKPAANFYLGTFYAESLILAETGNHVGAIQIAGTAMPSQLPFFITACDYTLIGEELFAASAYISRDPQMVGGLIGQDVAKILSFAIILIGSLSMTLSSILYHQDVSKISFKNYPMLIKSGGTAKVDLTINESLKALKAKFPLKLDIKVPTKYNSFLSFVDATGITLKPAYIDKNNAVYKMVLKKPAAKGKLEKSFSVKMVEGKSIPAEYNIKFELEGLNKEEFSVPLRAMINGGLSRKYRWLSKFVNFFDIRN